MSYSEKNVSYLKGVLGDKIVEKVVNGKKLTPEEKTAKLRIRRTLDKMEAYGDDQWWLSKDDEKVLRRQVAEPMLMISIERFIQLINNKLGTEIKSEEDLLRNWGHIRTTLGVRCA